MIDVCYWKLFNAKYADNDDIGAALYDAQIQCFKYEGMGTHVTERFADKLAGDEDDVYPKLSKYTSQEEFDEAMFFFGSVRLDVFCLHLMFIFD